MKIYTYIKEIIKNNVSDQSQCLNYFLRSWNLNQMIFKCSLVHNGIIMLMIMISLS
jgi:hypothetical protein